MEIPYSTSILKLAETREWLAFLGKNVQDYQKNSAN